MSSKMLNKKKSIRAPIEAGSVSIKRDSDSQPRSIAGMLSNDLIGGNK